MGLSGVGDLIVTCTSVHSRNWRCGDQLGQGKPLDEVIEDMGMVIEGINTAKAAYDLSREEHIECRSQKLSTMYCTIKLISKKRS